ncbi:MAG: UDP-N-acetylmuramoyl-L-alanine--D-glutamate ligase [Candidatus Omnitrophica bacterium]|nr:UDP-N-acetylmuramoyl-L-alanine--D-glutamate ligase [Candidatus Omnitrophota bacterium]
MIAVTGSNGKTTTTTLIDLALKAAGRESCLCGNIGIPFSGQADLLNDKGYVVLEVSSFQLESLLAGDPRQNWGEGFRVFRPRVAVVLNINENHLDRHSDMDEYAAAKTRIFQNQTAADFAVINGRDQRLTALAPSLKAAVSFFNSPSQPAELNGFDPNQLAVIAVAQALGIPGEVCRRVFAAFPGVEHRLEKVRELDGVLYVNDSKATTADSGRWALRQMKRPVVMICGGRDKHLDFMVLRDIVGEKVKALIAIGEAKDKLQQAFGHIVAVSFAQTMAEAVNLARSHAVAGDCVLLSPLCASFDMFDNFEHRGKVFKDIVYLLK